MRSSTTSSSLVQVQHCRSCGADILWLKNARTGKQAPVDAKPVRTGGNIHANLAAGTYTIVPKAERTGPLRVNHFGTCPTAAGWRKKPSADGSGSGSGSGSDGRGRE